MSVLDEIREEPWAYEFYPVLRRIERENPGKPKIGSSKLPADDAVRFGQAPGLGFASAPLAKLEAGGDGLPRLLVHFFGLLGPHGPLPMHLTEYVHDRVRDGDLALARFLDLFHHRMLSFFYRAWASGEPAVDFDRPQDACFNVYVGALFGLGMRPLRDRDQLPDLAKLHFAGRLSMPTRSEEGLRAMLEGFFDLPFRIETFVGQWLDVPEDARWRLGLSPTTGSLGRTTTLGARVWDCQQKFRIVVGPLDLVSFRRFLPGSPALGRLGAIVRNYFGDELGWDLRVLLDGAEVPALKLGGEERLGWTTWLPASRPADLAGDLILEDTRCATSVSGPIRAGSPPEFEPSVHQGA